MISNLFKQFLLFENFVLLRFYFEFVIYCTRHIVRTKKICVILDISRFLCLFMQGSFQIIVKRFLMDLKTKSATFLTITKHKYKYCERTYLQYTRFSEDTGIWELIHTDLQLPHRTMQFS